MKARVLRDWLLAPAVIGGLVALGYALRLGAWGRVWNLAIAAGLAGWIAWRLWGRWRDAAVSLASILFVLAAVEAVAIPLQSRPIEISTPGYSVSHPVLGWAPGAPGVYHHVKRHRGSGALIYDARYTIDAGGARAVASAEAGTPVVFLGDSMTYGTGINDADTLPQQFADAIGRSLPVRNLAMSGYGPQQVLRALETGLHDDRLRGAKLLVVQTAAFHAERTSCSASFVLRGPRYVLDGAVPRFQGACYENWWISLRSLFLASATYQQFVAPVLGGPSRADMELYIAVLIRAGALAREKYGVPMAILYLPRPAAYLANSGMTDAGVMDRLRAGGLQVIDGALDPVAFPNQPLTIPGDGHPTRVANRARAELLARMAGFSP